MAVKDLLIKLGVKGAKKAENQVKGIGSAFGSLAKSAAKAAAVCYGVTGIISGIQRTIEVSSKLKAVEGGFKNLTKGIGGASDTLNKLRDATDGTVNSIDLMTQANNAMLLGIFDNNDQMADMFDVAQRLGAALGQDTLFGVESLVTGMGRQSKLMLDNLGIMVDMEEANERHAELLGKTTAELTDQEKKQAFNNETMRQARILVGTLGEENLTTSDRINMLKASATDMAGTLGKALTPAFNASLDVMSEFATRTSEILNAIVQIDFKKTGQNVLDNLNALGNAIVDTFRVYFDGIPDIIKNSFSKIAPIYKKIFSSLMDAVQKLGSVVWEPLSVGMKIAAANIQNLFIKMLNGIKAQFNKLSETFIGEKLGITPLSMTDLIDTQGLSLAKTSIGEFFSSVGEDNIQSQQDLTSALGNIWSNYIDQVIEGKDQIIEGPLPELSSQLESTKDKTNENTDAWENFKKSMDEATASSVQQGAAITNTANALKGAEDAAKSVAVNFVSAEITKAVAGYIRRFLLETPLPPFVSAPLACGAAVGSLMGSAIQRAEFAEGGLVPGIGNTDSVPAMLTPGEVILNRAQQENLVGGMGVTVNIQGNMVGNESFVRDTLIPEISKAQNQGLA